MQDKATSTTGGMLYVVPTATHVRRYHLPILEALSQCGHAITLAIGEGQIGADEAHVADVVVNAGLAHGSSASALDELRVLMQRRSFDIVSTADDQTYHDAAFVARALRAAGIKPQANIVLSFGLGFDEGTGRLRRLVRMRPYRKMRKSIDLLMVMNTDDLKTAQQRGLGRSVRLVPGTGVALRAVGHNGPSGEARQQARLQLGCRDDDFVVVYAGRFDKNHDQRRIVDSMLYVNRDVRLFLVGTGPQRALCEKRVHDLRLESNVIMPGEVDDIAPYIRAADVTLSACRHEGLPSCVIAGLAQGTPAVVSAVKGNLDVVANGFNGLTFAPNDAHGFVTALRALQFDDGLRRRLCAHAPGSVAEYDTGHAVRAIVGCYDEVLAGVRNG